MIGHTIKLKRNFQNARINNQNGFYT